MQNMETVVTTPEDIDGGSNVNCISPAQKDSEHTKCTPNESFEWLQGNSCSWSGYLKKKVNGLNDGKNAM